MPPPLSAAPVALVVDDLLLNRVLLAAALRRLGYAVTQAADGHEALRHLRQSEFAVVFLDWDLPGLGGDELAAFIRARPSPAPIIAITADDSAEMRARCRRAGVAGFLGKTFDFASLRAVLAVPSSANGPAAGGTTGMTGGASAGPQGRDMLTALLGRSHEHLLGERAKLDEALRSGRVTDALRSLHNLTSLANMVGASPISEAARGLEDCLRTGSPADEALAALDARIARFHPPASGGASPASADDAR